MALAAWYPLISDMNNQGVGDADLTVTTTPSFAPGKLGTCISNGGGKWLASQTKNILNNTAISICFWIYPNVDTGSSGGIIFGTDGMTPPNNRKFSIYQYPTCNDLHLSWQNDASGTFAGGVWSGVFPSRTWTHCCVTYQNPSVTIYINGIESYHTSGVSNSASFEFDTPVIRASSARYLNDFRVYTHCLSAKAVKEISQGLILHYPMTGGCRYGANICSGTNTSSVSTNTFYFSEATGGSTRTIENDASGVPCIKITRNSTEHSGWSFLYYKSINRSMLKTSTTYTLSMDIIGSGSGSIGFSGFMNGNGTKNLSASTSTVQGRFNSDTWSHLVFRTTTISDFESVMDNQVVYMGCNFLHTVNTWIMMKNLKVEEGSEDTPWIPYVSDTKYTSGGYDSAIEYDISGYHRDGTINGNISYSTDTLRNLVSSSLPGVATNYISAASLPTETKTAACWMKSSEQTSVAFVDYNSHLCIALYQGNKIVSYCGSSAGGAGSIVDLPSNKVNTWIHVVVVSTGSNTRDVYCDGVKCSNSSTTGYYTHATDALFIGRRSLDTYPFSGLLSDIRAYVTQLSATDIKQLYEETKSHK